MIRAHWKAVLSAVAGLAVLAAVYVALAYAPREATMGDVQRIMYVHIPVAWVGFLALVVTFLASIGTLVRDAQRWDALAACSAELGTLFLTMTLITGSLWAKVAWNTWWTWSPRLTLSAVVWLVYVAYLMLRRVVDDLAQRARFAAVYGIVAFVSVPLDFFAIRWWRSIHPVLLTGQGMAMTGRMGMSLGICLGAFTLLYTALLSVRVSQERIQNALYALEE